MKTDAVMNANQNAFFFKNPIEKHANGNLSGFKLCGVRYAIKL
jgi:hypothetical protein